MPRYLSAHGPDGRPVLIRDDPANLWTCDLYRAQSVRPPWLVGTMYVETVGYADDRQVWLFRLVPTLARCDRDRSLWAIVPPDVAVHALARDGQDLPEDLVSSLDGPAPKAPPGPAPPAGPAAPRPGCAVGPAPEADRTPPPPAPARTPEAPAERLDLVTLNQAAAMVHRKKRTLERYKTKGTLPDPVSDGGGGAPALYDWKVMRPWLTEMFGIALPEKFPANRVR